MAAVFRALFVFFVLCDGCCVGVGVEGGSPLVLRRSSVL